MPNKVKIAIVEDDIAIVQMYRMKLESEGFQVQTAGEGESGISLVETFKPDILLLDLMMPNMGGVEMLAELRKKPAGKDLKVIVLTNMGENEVPEEMQSLDVSDFIVKADMTPKEVLERVKEILGR